MPRPQLRSSAPFRKGRLTYPISIALSFLVCCSLLFSSLVLAKPTTASGQGQARRGRPEAGPPAATLPNLDEVRRKRHPRPEAPPHLPSVMRARRKSLMPRNGRKVGDPGTMEGTIGMASEPGLGSTAADEARTESSLRSQPSLARSQTRKFNHGRPRVNALAPPPIADDQYVQTFFQWALARTPNTSEQAYWNDILRAAYSHAQSSMVMAVREMGKTLFESAEYSARTDRQGAVHDSDYVSDLYHTYLLRNPDSGGLNYWTGLVSSIGRENVRRAFDECGEFISKVATVTPNGGASGAVTSLLTARVDAANQSGNQLLARDGEWGLTLLSLAGRAGLDLGLGLSYSSAGVWTRSGPYTYFDDDNSSLSPGFRIGFPTVQEQFFNAQTGQNAYLLITSAGSRVELRQVGSSNIYEAADSSYLQLTDNGGSLLLRPTDGTRMSYSKIENEWRCTQVKDRNGNFISVNYNSLGDVTTVIDTLGRTVTFNYDGNANLISITQIWHRDVQGGGQTTETHQWATFGWGSITIQPNFSDVALSGIANGQTLPVLTMVGLDDGTYYKFAYTNWNSGQVSRITHYASDSNPTYDNHERSHTVFTYSAADDTTRLTETRVAAESWTGINGVPSEVITQFGFDGGSAYWLNSPDGTVYKEFYGTEWQKRLPQQTETWSGGVRQKWTTTTWTQDNIGGAYQLNPRATETNIYDAAGNRRRTSIDYYPAFGLPGLVTEYGANSSTPVRFTVHGYKNDDCYISRRIIGLPYQDQVFDGNWQLASKIGYEYDWRDGYMTQQAPAMQHDTTNYGANLDAGRGILVAVRRYNVNAPDDTNQAVWLTQRGYNLAGGTTFTRDAAGHQTNISYDDSFSDGNNSRNTLAYPSTVKDPDWNASTAPYNYSTVQYNFDMGTKTRVEGPRPSGQSQGAIETFVYDTASRLDRVTNANNGAYSRYVYGPYYVQSYSSVNNVADDTYAIQTFDGRGREIGAAGNHPGSVGTYKAQMTSYDQMGRVIKRSNPAEITSAWAPAGDDAAGWQYTQQTYDWRGRPLVQTNTDGTTKENSYGGCGCAGGEVVTLTDEGTVDGGVAKRRQKRIYRDVLGRVWKSEILNWQGGDVYTATVSTYNARDQVTLVRQFAGPEGSQAYQDTSLSYDGHGRLSTKHSPEQTAGTATSYNYNSDDTVNSITDARVASTIYVYNGRHLATGVSYGAPSGSGIAVPAAVSYAYDAAGNRTSMTDGLGSKSYTYNQLSDLMSETRTLTGVGTFALSYDYNLAGELKKITDPTNVTINYGYDAVGQLTGVTGSDTLYAGVSTYASNLKFRGWGGLKQVTDGSNHTSNVSYDARLEVSHFDVSGSVVSQNYTYYNDGRVSFVQNSTDANFDRSYSYDHAGRITEAKSGGQARNGYGDVPYHETFDYENWSNVTYRLNESWNQEQAFEDFATYANNRRVGWGYDADGRNTTVETRTMSYDAAGQQVSMAGQQWIFNHYIPVTQSSGYDGDGNKIKNVTGAGTTYYLTSNALDGRLVEELNSSGQKNVGYVYAPGGELLAEQSYNGVIWRHVTPAGTGKYETYSYASYSGRVEFDPVGADINLTGPIPPDTGGGDGDVGTYHFGGLMSRLTSDFFNTANDCVVNGSRESCSVAMFYVNMGTGRKDYTKDSSTTMDDLGKALGVVFTPAGVSPNSLISAGLDGTADFSYDVMGWVEDPATKIEYWVPVPTYFIGLSAVPGSAVTMATGLLPQNPYQRPPDSTKDPATFNCVGLACQTYKYQGDLGKYLEFLKKGRKLEKSTDNCKPGEVKFWLWTYGLVLKDEQGNEIDKVPRDFHTVAGQMDPVSGADPTNVYSKNGKRPIRGPGTGPSFKPPARERATNNSPKEQPLTTKDGRQIYKERTNMEESIYCLPAP